MLTATLITRRVSPRNADTRCQLACIDGRSDISARRARARLLPVGSWTTGAGHAALAKTVCGEAAMSLANSVQSGWCGHSKAPLWIDRLGQTRKRYVSLFGDSNAGLELTDRPAFSVQYHPEAGLGPQYNAYLFERLVGSLHSHE